jgi:hypothetical protein
VSEADSKQTPGGVDSLQFEKAELLDNSPKCGICDKPLEAYYRLGENKICSECADSVRAGQERPKNRLVARGALYGAGAAVLCCIGYALIVWITGLEIGLIAILVGYLIGSAVRKGSAGLGGRRLQLVAVALTYFAITFSYIPLLVKGSLEAAEKDAKAAAASASKNPQSPQKSPDPAASKTAAPNDRGKSPSLGGLALALVFFAGLSAVVPFLQLTDGFSGIIGLAIIFFGLQRAWSLTARSDVELHGPFSDAQPEEQASTAHAS